MNIDMLMEDSELIYSLDSNVNEMLKENAYIYDFGASLDNRNGNLGRRHLKSSSPMEQRAPFPDLLSWLSGLMESTGRFGGSRPRWIGQPGGPRAIRWRVYGKTSPSPNTWPGWPCHGLRPPLSFAAMAFPRLEPGRLECYGSSGGRIALMPSACVGSS